MTVYRHAPYPTAFQATFKDYSMPQKRKIILHVEGDIELSQNIINSATVFMFNTIWSVGKYNNNGQYVSIHLEEWERLDEKKWWSEEKVLIQQCKDKSLNLVFQNQFYKCKLNVDEDSAEQPSAEKSKAV